MNFISLGSTTKIKTGKLDANANNPNGLYPFFTCSKDTLRIDSYSYDCECVLVAGNGDLNVKHYKGKFDAYQRTYIIESLDTTKLNVRYLYYFLEFYVARLRELAIGGVIKYIKLGHLTEAKIPLRSLYEQKRIVSILDLATSLVKKRKAQIEALDQLTQSVFLEMFGDPLLNEKKWSVKPLGYFLERIDSGWSPKCNAFPANNDEKGVLKLSAVTKGIYIPSENKALPDSSIFKAQLEVKQGDILITRKNTRELIGACVYVFKTPKFLMIPDTIYRLVFNSKEEIDRIFLWRLLNNELFRKKITSLAEGSSGSMPNISKKKLLRLEIIAPPIELQDKFAEFIMKIEEQRLKFKQSEHLLEHNFNSIIQRAFKGELFTEEKLPTA
ncbi:restriction endonuclease subunit S [Shouchella rhizosphaerae]|uniref:Restriction endonuclease subunit S n=1 Tax=Shouchella rhizosphaerae TaxID=866786 RepID=A0ABZ2CNZ9_9BACI